jgi:hypothetical protein
VDRTSYFVHTVMNHATAQTVSHWLPTAAAPVRPQVRSCGIWGGQSGTGVVPPPRTSVSLGNFDSTKCSILVYQLGLVQYVPSELGLNSPQELSSFFLRRKACSNIPEDMTSRHGAAHIRQALVHKLDGVGGNSHVAMLHTALGWSRFFGRTAATKNSGQGPAEGGFLVNKVAVLCFLQCSQFVG